MKTHAAWSYHPYRAPFLDVGEIYICRVAPGADFVTVEWLDEGRKPYTLFLRRRGAKDFTAAAAISGTEYTVTGLETGCEYEFYVTDGEKKSRVRLCKCAPAVGTVVNYLHPEDDAYAFSGKALCSPSLLHHPDGYLLASMDVFKADWPQCLTIIFRSDDEGKTWHYVSELFPCFWAKMFYHRGSVYVLGCSTEYGDLLIGRSDDGAKTFTAPTVLLRGGNGKHGQPGIHKNPQPVVSFGGRLWNTLEWGSWGRWYHAAMVMSVPEDAELLDAENWSFSEPVKYDPGWPGVPKGPSSGNIEGCLVVCGGKLWNVMRYDMEKLERQYGLAVVYRVNTEDPEAPLEYDHVMEFPANGVKFEMKQHPRTGKWYAIGNRVLSTDCRNHRNLLSLFVSDDGEHWQVERDVYDRRNDDPDKTGFQYVDFFFEGDEIWLLCRTALNDPINFHDSNYSTFDKLKLFP